MHLPAFAVLCIISPIDYKKSTLSNFDFTVDFFFLFVAFRRLRLPAYAPPPTRAVFTFFDTRILSYAR